MRMHSFTKDSTKNLPQVKTRNSRIRPSMRSAFKNPKILKNTSSSTIISFFNEAEEIAINGEILIKKLRAAELKKDDMSLRPSTTIRLNKFSKVTKKMIKLRKNSFSQTFFNPSNDYKACIDYEEKRGWRSFFGWINKNADHEKIVRVVDELKHQKEKLKVKEAIKIKKLGTIYRQKE